MNLVEEINLAHKRIDSFIKRTDVIRSSSLSRLIDGDVFLKLENSQPTGSFKLRGAANKILSLDKEETSKGLLTASSGNHGGAFAYMVDQLGIEGTIYLPETVSTTKLETLKQYDVETILIGNDSVIPELEARKQSELTGKIYVSPYNDSIVVAGQGTIGLELNEQIKELDSVIVPVGGGGLIGGIASYLKNVNPSIKIYACQPKNSAVMYESIRAGYIVEMESKPTLSDGTAGGIETDTITFDLCKKHVDDFFLVIEEDIRKGIIWAIENQNLLIEGAAALTIASLINHQEKFRGQTVALIICGGKISVEKLSEVLAEEGSN